MAKIAKERKYYFCKKCGEVWGTNFYKDNKACKLCRRYFGLERITSEKIIKGLREEESNFKLIAKGQDRKRGGTMKQQCVKCGYAWNSRAKPSPKKCPACGRRRVSVRINKSREVKL